MLGPTEKLADTDTVRFDREAAPIADDVAKWFAHPMFGGIRPDRELFLAVDPNAINAQVSRERNERPLRFAAQTAELLADGLHYEQRIAQGIVATRAGNTHDAFNALIWLRHRAVKQAMNTRQVSDIARVGTRQRTRSQCALTHFDEAGAIVWVDDDDTIGADVVAAWNAHDWAALFGARAQAWGSRIAVTVFGHALFDYALAHDELPVAKALLVRTHRDEVQTRSHDALIAAWPEMEQCIAREIDSGGLLADPQELRPLPLAGIPGWHAEATSAAFFATTPCFRPLRAGRRYPEPVRVNR